MEKGNKIILILGFLAIAVGVFIFYEASSFQKKAIFSEGKVIHVIGSSYKIQYFIADGSEKTFQGSGKNHQFREGNNVQLWYSSSNPDKVRLTDGKKTAKTLFIAGFVCILLGIYPLFIKKR
jgi:uncharacterized membrane protein